MNYDPLHTGLSQRKQQNRQLRNHLRAIETAWQALCQHWHHLQLTCLYRQIHTLTQDASRLGYTQLSIHTKPLEMQLQQFQLQGIVPNAQQQVTIQTQIQRLHDLVQKLGNTPVQAPTLLASSISKPLIYLFEPDLEQRESLSLQLELSGYIVRNITEEKTLMNQCQKQAPQAILLAVQSPKEPQLGLHIAQNLREQCDNNFPIILLSQDDAIDNKLAAYRLHIDGYFSIPIDVKALVHKLKKLIQTQMQHVQVLIVDEDKTLGLKYVEYLKNANIQAKLLNKPQQLLDSIQQLQPDVVLIHTQLNHLSSIELAMLIRQHKSHDKLPVLFFAQRFDHTFRRTLMHKVANDFLAEDISEQALVDTVKQHINPQTQVNLADIDHHKDRLTKLYHRDYLLNALKLIKDEKNLFVISLSLDNYRSIDSLMGVIASDALLQNSAKQLQKLVGKRDILARTHENGFAILSFDRQLGEMQDLAEQIRHEIKTHVFKLNGQHLSSSCSIGIAGVSAETETPAQILLDAGAACSLAQQHGGNRIQWHSNHQHLAKQQIKTLAWEKKLREGLSQDQFQLHFQAISNLQNDSMCCYEVLLQLKQQQKTLQSGEFLPIAEYCGLSERIERWMVKQAILTLKQQANTQVNLLLTLSEDTLADPHFLTWLEKSLRITKLAKNRALIFDFSRKDIHQHFATASHVYQYLRQLGCRLSIRDMEPNKDSLLLLNRLPVDFIRLSPHLVSNLSQNQERSHSLLNLISQAHQQQKAVISPFTANIANIHLLGKYQVDHIVGQFVQTPHQQIA